MPTFVFSFDIKPNKKVSGYSSVVRITDGKKDCCDVGNRVPNIKFYSNTFKMQIAFSLNGKGSVQFNTEPLKEGVYSTVVIKQTFTYGTSYRYSIAINGEEVYQAENKKAQEFKNLKLYAGDEYTQQADVFIKNLKLNNIAGKWFIFLSVVFFTHVYPKSFP